MLLGKFSALWSPEAGGGGGVGRATLSNLSPPPKMTGLYIIALHFLTVPNAIT